MILLKLTHLCYGRITQQWMSVTDRYLSSVKFFLFAISHFLLFILCINLFMKLNVAALTHHMHRKRYLSLWRKKKLMIIIIYFWNLFWCNCNGRGEQQIQTSGHLADDTYPLDNIWEQKYSEDMMIHVYNYLDFLSFTFFIGVMSFEPCSSDCAKKEKKEKLFMNSNYCNQSG